MIFQYKNKTYCLTDWANSPFGINYCRRLVMENGKPSWDNMIGFEFYPYDKYILSSRGCLKEIFDLYFMYDKSIIEPVYSYDNTLIHAKDKLDNFLLRVDKIKAFI